MYGADAGRVAPTAHAGLKGAVSDRAGVRRSAPGRLLGQFGAVEPLLAAGEIQFSGITKTQATGRGGSRILIFDQLSVAGDGADRGLPAEVQQVRIEVELGLQPIRMGLVENTMGLVQPGIVEGDLVVDHVANAQRIEGLLVLPPAGVTDETRLS